MITTGDYILNKEPVGVKKGDIVTYTFRIYNEGTIDGYAQEITEEIPEGLEFIWSEKTDSELEADTTLSDEEKEAIKYNQGIWDIDTINKETNKVELITTDYLAKGKGAEIATEGANLIKAFDSSKGYKNTINDKNPDYKEVSVYLKVISEAPIKTVIRRYIPTAILMVLIARFFASPAVFFIFFLLNLLFNFGLPIAYSLPVLYF